MFGVLRPLEHLQVVAIVVVILYGGSCDRVCLTPGSPSQRARPCNQIGSFTEYYQWAPLICGFLSYSKIKSLKKSQFLFYHLPLARLNLSSLFHSEFKVNHFPILETGAALHEHKVSLSRMGASLSIVLRHLLFMLYHIHVSVLCHIPEAEDRWVCLFYDCSFDLDGIFAPDLRIFFVFKEFFYFFFKELML